MQYDQTKETLQCAQLLAANMDPAHLQSVSMNFRFSGLRISLSRTVTIWQKRGLSLRSFCQQSNMSVCRAAGQPMGAGSR